MRSGQRWSWRLVAAFAAVYLIWGSTYLGIRIAIETIPPFLVAGVRFVLAGTVLYLWERGRGAVPPSAREWSSAAVTGVLLVVGGNAVVVWAEQLVPSGLAALIISVEPLMIVTLLWALSGERPSTLGMVGLLGGLVGVGLLFAPTGPASGRVSLWGAGALVLAALSWAIGSLYARRAPQPASPRIGTGATMLTGGVAAALVSVAVGEPGQFDPSTVSATSVAAVLYLAVFGSLIAFSAYVWLMRATTPGRASTYAYVNPVVALVLGWWVAGESLTPRSVTAAGIILASVALIVTVGSGVRRERGAPARFRRTRGRLNRPSDSTRKAA